MNSNTLPKTWQNLLDLSGFMPVLIKSIETFRADMWVSEENSHKYYEMVYVKQGQGVFDVEGKKFKTGPNDIVIIQPNKKHTFEIKSDKGCEYIMLYFSFVSKFNDEDSKKKYRMYSEVSLDDFINFVSGDAAQNFINLKVNQKNEIINILNSIIHEQNSQDGMGSELMVHLLIMQLFVMISRALKMEWENSIKTKEPKLKELIETSVSYIENNFERDITLNDISKYVFLSSSYFARMFKKEMGISPISLLLKTRVERAKELLTQTDMKAAEIALCIGFSNQQRFNEIFKKYADMTPIQYRKSMRE